MFSRSRRNVLARFEEYKAKNRIDTGTAGEAIRYCFRYVKRGHSCAIIVPDNQSVKLVMDQLEMQCAQKLLHIQKKKEDGFILDGDIEVRVLPKINESLAHIMLGNNAKIIRAKEGDPKVQKFKEIMDL